MCWRNRDHPVASTVKLLAIPEIKWHLRETGWQDASADGDFWILPSSAPPPEETLHVRIAAILDLACSVTFLPANDIFKDPADGVDGFVSFEEIPTLLVGATVSGQWKLTRHLFSGTFGRGWVAKDVKNNAIEFVKTFRALEDNDKYDVRETFFLHFFFSLGSVFFYAGVMFEFCVH